MLPLNAGGMLRSARPLIGLSGRAFLFSQRATPTVRLPVGGRRSRRDARHSKKDLVSGWLARIRDALAGSAALTGVRAELDGLRRSRTPIELEPTAGPDEAGTMTTTIEALEAEGIIVSRPIIGGVLRPLGRFEQLIMRFSGPRGQMTGQTQSQGRIRIPSGGGDVIFGYRLAYPEELRLDRATRPADVLLGTEPVREAELHVLGRQGPILGLVDDITPQGARLRCRNAGEDLTAGKSAYFKITLPDPVGPMHEAVTIMSTRPVADGGQLVNVSFLEAQDRIAEALRNERRGTTDRRRSA